MSEQLNILILTLTTGEEVIANVQDHVENINGEERRICYNMIYPFVISKSGPLQKDRIDIVFRPWKIFSCDTSFLIGFDNVVNMCSPFPDVTNQYKRACDQFIKNLAEQQQKQQ